MGLNTSSTLDMVAQFAIAPVPCSGNEEIYQEGIQGNGEGWHHKLQQWQTVGPRVYLCKRLRCELEFQAIRKF